MAPAERLGFSPSVMMALKTDDVVRLTVQRDPWWTSITRDAVPLTGGHPEDLAAALTRPQARGWLDQEG
jgi:hypothetical protein